MPFMAPHIGDREEGGSGRRKSIHLFSRTSLSSLTHIHHHDTTNNHEQEEGGEKKEKRLSKRSPLFGLGPPSSHTSPDISQEGIISPTYSDISQSPKMRPRTLQKGRPSSLFGSLGRRSMTHVDEEIDNLAGTTPESLQEDRLVLDHPVPSGKSIIHHGEVQTTSGMFRKKKEYLVLTETHLVRFKSQSRASEAFPSIPPANGRGNTTRHPSTTSIGSLQDTQSNQSHTSAEGENRIPLGQVVTTYKVEDGKPFFTSEVVYLDEEYHGVGSLQLILHDPKDADLWLTSIKGAAEKARLIMAEPYPERVVRYLVQVVEGANDYDANHFQVFRVVRRAAVPKGGRSSSDDIQKLVSAVFYMVVGINMLHMIPLPDFNEASTRLLNPKTTRNALGLVSLVSMNVQYSDDRFELGFRTPLQPVKVLELAASATPDIAVVIFRACQYLKPQWLDFSFSFGGPRRLLDAVEFQISLDEEDYGCFERTLVAYCMAYNCNPVNIQYAVDWEVEDAPEFRLFRPANTAKYSLYELVAIMRALRYNEFFRSISFKDIDLHSMHGVFDVYGTDHVAWATRSGISIEKYFNIKPQDRSMLYQEIQALGLKSRRLRRMDFCNALPRRRPRDTFDEEGGVNEKDPGCEIVAALLPLCRGQLTNVDWIVLSGIELGETDLDDLTPALNEPQSRIRALECSRSGLNDRGIMLLLGTMERQTATLECISIADNPGRINLERFQISMSRFSNIRMLDLSRITRTSGETPLFVPEVMLSWRLEELIMNGVPVNDKTLDTISAYLMSDMSNDLRTLQMDQCNLNGSHVAVLMRSMARVSGEARNMELHVSANRLEKGIGEIVKAIEENYTPSHLVVRMIEFTKEDYFKQLLEALRTNTTVRSLDISKASLPYDASPETCDALRLVFAENTTLEDLDISGEQAHLEVTRFGIGLNHALTGLRQNKTLKSLRIEYQNLGLEGANTLSTVIEENTGLTHILCEHNDINLQGFTILVNAIAKNFTVLELPFMHDDQGQSLKRINESMRDSRRTATSAQHDHHVKSSVRRTLTSLGVSKSQVKPDITTQDVDDMVRVIGEKWENEIDRLAMFLERNRNIVAGVDGFSVDGEGMLSEEALRPTTALSDKGILDQVISNTTPKVELRDPVDAHITKVAGLGILSTDRKGENGKPSSVDGADNKSQPARSKVDGDLLPELPIANEKMFELEGGLFQMET
ncbi:hypothetical protein B7494_g1234 [Chlorociboria aeruginascens]|nr:hypothetical protein B7494_g1234 [Chlorociboria aeruginascens]